MRLDKSNLRVLAGILSAFLIIGVIHQVRPHVKKAPDFPCSSKVSGNEVLIEVSAGQTGAEIARNLEEKKVIASSAAFFRLAVGDKRAGSIAPGIHRMSQGICAKEALNQLLDSKRIANLLTIIEGEWNREIYAELQTLGFAKSEIESSAKAITLPTGFNSLEGLLFPAQYSFDPKSSLTEIFTSIMNRGLRELKAAGLDRKIDGFTPQQLLIMASLVQAEGDEKDFSKISQVIRNRLAIGMPLQFDSTVHYIKGSRGSMFLSTQSTYLNSPYNTYRKYGLPPAPINNPGSPAMIAAAQPTSGPWLYFITVAPGDTRFTDSLIEFNTWKALYKKNLKAGKFRSVK